MLPIPMKEHTRYTDIDLPFYRSEIAPLLPPAVLDFHAHVWMPDHWRVVPWKAGTRGGKYMVTNTQYSPSQLLADAARMFPGKAYKAVCFGNPTPSVDLSKTNRFVGDLRRRYKNLCPLMVAGKGLASPVELRAALDRGFYGFKVFLNWWGDNYGNVRVRDMIGPDELRLADERRLVVLLHVPGSRRLADPAVRDDVRRYAGEYPRAQFVLAHCGRCYHPDEMKKAIGGVADLKNVSLDTSMVMDPTVIQMVFDNVPSRRVLFATDYPVAAMRGRRVYVMDHWVDLVLEGYPASQYRVASDNMRATFMAWEIALAIRRAGEMCGLKRSEIRAIFHANGMAVLERVIRP